MAKTRIVGYVRVSTEKQAQEGLGLQVQQEAIKRWARENGYRLVKICSDNGVSGTLEDTDRPGLTEALNLIAAGKADGLVVYTLDRLARRLHIQEAVLQKVWQHGGRAFSVESGEILQDDPEDPVRTFVRQVLGAVSELERGMIGRRLRNGRRAKSDRGGFAYGSPPFGYRAEAGELVPDKEEQKALDLIRRLHGQGRSLRQIAEALEAAGHKPRRADHWHAESVRRIVGRS